MGALGRYIRGVTGAVFEFLRRPVYRRRLFVVLAGLFVCFYAAGVFWYVLWVPYLGLRCAFTPVINQVTDGFVRVPEGQEEPALDGCAVVQVGDAPVKNWGGLLRALSRLRDEAPAEVDAFPAAAAAGGPTHVRLDGEEWVRVRYQPPPDKPGVPRRPEGEVWCRVGRLPLGMLLPSVLWFFLKAGLCTVAALVLWKRPEDLSAARFLLLSIVTFGAYVGGFHWSLIATQPVLLLVFMVCGILLPAVTLHFYLVFPRPRWVLERYPVVTLAVVYVPPLLFLLVLVWGYLHVRWLYRSGSDDDGLEKLLIEILVEVLCYFVVAAVWYVASVVCLVISWRTARDTTERNQVKTILFGGAAALVPIGYTLYLAFWERQQFGAGAATWPMFAASVCVTGAYVVAITRYRLMQLDQLISSGVSYFLLSTLAGLVYYAVVFVGTLLFSVGWMAATSVTWVQALGVSSAALVLMLLLGWLRGRVKKVLDRRFYREKHHLDRTLKRLSLAIEQLVDPPTLARRLLGESAELLGVARGSVYLREGTPPLYCLADSLGDAPPLTELSSGCPLVEGVRDRGTVLAPPRGASPADAPPERQLRLLGGEVALALTHEGQLLALLVLGPKQVGVYGPDDLNLLAAFAQITALALVSAEGHRTIDALNRDLQAKVEKIAEQQRRILALQAALSNQKSEVRGQRSEARGQRPEAQEKGSPAGPSNPRPLTSDAPGIIGSSLQVRQLLQLVRKVSDSQATVLLRGESGTGKELLARALHDNSARAGKPFVKVHCAALSAGLLESELFGHVKGAFTSAHRDKVGRFELAHGGTLFLDEIGDVSLDVQTKLLRVLQERTFERVGSSEPVRVDVRVLAATHRDLEQLIREGRFREDLYYRLNVITIRVPALRERREDIPELAQHFLRLAAQRSGRDVAQLDDDALAALKAFSWPGNVRQLENVIERAVVVAEGTAVTLDELPPEVCEPGGEDTAPEPAAEEEPGGPWGGGLPAERAERDRREREQLVRALAATGGNKAEAARLLGMARSTLVSRLKKHGLQ
jgi:transcriptional regulator with GAF, ATPase, and Fis domain